jgi:hypothetical protein
MRVKACAAVLPAESVTWTSKLNDPAAVGVPESVVDGVPLAPSVSPGGRARRR